MSSSDSYKTDSPRTNKLTAEQISLIKAQTTETAKTLKRRKFGIKEVENHLFKLNSVDFFR